MYQQIISSESITDYTSECKVYLRLLNNTVEDAVIGRQLVAAIKQAEQKCNRAFTAKLLTVKSTNYKFDLLGVLDSTKTIVAKIDSVVTTDYEITGDVQPSIEFTGSGTIYEVSYSTKADMPEMVKEWVFEKVNRLFNRNSDDVTLEDDSLLDPYKNLIWLP